MLGSQLRETDGVTRWTSPGAYHTLEPPGDRLAAGSGDSAANGGLVARVGVARARVVAIAMRSTHSGLPTNGRSGAARCEGCCSVSCSRDATDHASRFFGSCWGAEHRLAQIPTNQQLRDYFKKFVNLNRGNNQCTTKNMTDWDRQTWNSWSFNK